MTTIGRIYYIPTSGTTDFIGGTFEPRTLSVMSEENGRHVTMEVLKKTAICIILQFV